MTMAGYRRVNYYELCRLCTSSEGTKMHIFREEGRRRQLPTKIQICLPLQVCEDDSLPKIICSHCVDKLESFYDFRESCVNAEAMLESYFTSLRYSNDFTREGKVYVKDESPPKKKATSPGDASAPADSKQLIIKPMLPDGLNSLVQAQGIQIVTDEDGTRVQQYKCQVQMGAGGAGSGGTVLEAAEARYSYEPCGTQRTSDGNNMAKEDGSTQCSENDFNAKAAVIARHQNQTPDSSDGDLSNQQQPITFSTSDPTANQMLVHFNFKDRVDPDQQALQRSSMAQIGEFLRIKSVNLDVPSNPVIVEAPAALMQAALTTRINCDRCLKQYSTLEDFQNHPCTSSDGGVGGDDPSSADGGVDPDDPHGDKNGPSGGGTFSCEICAKPFKRKEHLFQHRKLHTGERPYICVSCGKAFSRKEHLVRHAVSHTGQKTHACDLCGKTFSRKDNLHKHRKTHGIAGPYICETCGKSFVVKHYYMMHKNSHADPHHQHNDDEDMDSSAAAAPPAPPNAHKCDICGKSFTTKSYLSSHKLRHKKTAAKYEVSEAQQLLSRLTDVGSQHLLGGGGGQGGPLTTINNAALLAPNLLHHVAAGGGEMASVQQVGSAAAYLCAPTTVAASELIETYRRLHST